MKGKANLVFISPLYEAPHPHPPAPAKNNCEEGMKERVKFFFHY
jgi:hypothetical protein